MDGLDDLCVVDSAEVTGCDREIGVTELALDHDREIPSRDISTACACRN
jgi:hypothetical protein